MSFHGVSYGPRTLSGAGSIERLGAEVKALAGPGAAVLLVADSGLKPFGVIGRAVAAMEAAGLSVAAYADIAGEPKEEQVEAARRLGKSARAKAVVCLGGGSALDAGKLAAVMLGSDAPVSDFRLAREAAAGEICADRLRSDHRRHRLGDDRHLRRSPTRRRRNSGSGERRSRRTSRCSIRS